MVDEQFEVGTKVWGKVKGHPWWPAQVADLDDLSQRVLSQKPKRPSYYIPVLFYGSNNYGWLQTDAIRHFDDPTMEVPRKTAMLVEAIQRARDDEAPDGKLKVFEDDGESEDDENDEEDDEEKVEMDQDEEDDVDENLVKSSAKKPKTTKKTPAKTPASERKSKNGKRKSAETDETPSKRKRREKSPQDEEEDAEEEETYKKKASKAKTPSKANKNTKRVDEQADEEPEKKKEKTRSDHDQLMYFRHKVQKMMKESPETLASSSKIDGIMTEVESFPMTLSLLKDTKMGKLMKRMSQIKFTEDPYGIKDRTHRLMKRWKNDFAENVDKDEETEVKKTTEEVSSSSIGKDEKENHRESPAKDPTTNNNKKEVKEVSSTLEENLKKSLDEPRSPVKESDAKQEPVVVTGEEKGLAEQPGSDVDENRELSTAEIRNE